MGFPSNIHRHCGKWLCGFCPMSCFSNKLVHSTIPISMSSVVQPMSSCFVSCVKVWIITDTIQNAIRVDTHLTRQRLQFWLAELNHFLHGYKWNNTHIHTRYFNCNLAVRVSRSNWRWKGLLGIYTCGTKVNNVEWWTNI